MSVTMGTEMWVLLSLVVLLLLAMLLAHYHHQQMRKMIEKIIYPPEPTHYLVNVAMQGMVPLEGHRLRTIASGAFSRPVYRIVVSERENAPEGMEYRAEVWDALARVRMAAVDVEQQREPIPGVFGVPYWLVDGQDKASVVLAAQEWIEEQQS